MNFHGSYFLQVVRTRLGMPREVCFQNRAYDFSSIQYKFQVSNYIFQLLHSNIDEEIESSLLINN